MSKNSLQINKTIHLFLLNRANSLFVLIPMLLLSSFFIITSIILPIYYIDEWPISLAVCLLFLALAIFALSGQFVGLHICPDGKVYVVPNILIKRFKWSEIEKIYISFNEFVQDSHFARTLLEEEQEESNEQEE